MYLSPAYEFTCPSCGKYLRGKVRHAASYICPGCQALIKDAHINPTLNPASYIAPLPHSFISIGTQGKLNRNAFEITGRIHYLYNDGFVNDWHIVTEERKNYWLSESFGHYFVFSVDPEPNVFVSDTSFVPGENSLTIQNQTLIYEGSDSCHHISFEGELPVDPLEIRLPFVSLNYCNDKVYACVHTFSVSEQKAYTGIRVSLEQLSLSNPSN